MTTALARSITGAAIVLTLAMAGQAMAQRGQRAQVAERSITQVAGDLYRFRNNNHYSVFLVTPEGVIVTDPINADAARWLKGEIASRFGQPVKYVIYSHHHADHASGGDVFADTTTFIGHELMAAALGRQESAGLPQRLRAADVNGNGKIERDEAPGRLAANFERIDADGDGAITAAELTAGQGGGVRPPDKVFAQAMTVELGGRSVELSYLGKSHSDNLIVMRFPEARAVSAVDFVAVKRLPFRNLRESYLPDWIDAIKALEAMDFDILVPGHGPVGVKADATDNRLFWEDLVAAVAEQVKAGKSLAEIQRTVKLEKYRDWDQYDAFLTENIEGVHRILFGGG